MSGTPPSKPNLSTPPDYKSTVNSQAICMVAFKLIIMSLQYVTKWFAKCVEKFTAFTNWKHFLLDNSDEQQLEEYSSSHLIWTSREQGIWPD